MMTRIKHERTLPNLNQQLPAMIILLQVVVVAEAVAVAVEMEC